MNYYEELNVSRSATAEDIQEAYRALAAVLHPDRQEKQRLRAVAERQMQRLNEIAAVLRDPASRHRYDAELQAQKKPASGTPKLVVTEALSTRIIWCFCLIIGFAGVFSYLRDDINHTRMVQTASVEPGCAETAVLEDRILQLEQEVRSLNGTVHPRAGGKP